MKTERQRDRDTETERRKDQKHKAEWQIDRETEWKKVRKTERQKDWMTDWQKERCNISKRHQFQVQFAATSSGTKKAVWYNLPTFSLWDCCSQRPSANGRRRMVSRGAPPPSRPPMRASPPERCWTMAAQQIFIGSSGPVLHSFEPSSKTSTEEIS